MTYWNPHHSPVVGFHYFHACPTSPCACFDRLRWVTYTVTDDIRTPSPGSEPLPPTEPTEPPLEDEDDPTQAHEAPEETGR